MDVGLRIGFASYGWDGASEDQVWDQEIRLVRSANGFDASGLKLFPEAELPMLCAWTYELVAPAAE